MSTRSDASSAAKALRDAVSNLRNLVAFATSAESQLMQAIKAATDRVIQQEVAQLASTAELRSLTFGSGVRINALESAGIRTVAEAARYSAARLQQLPGVGPTTASSVVQSVTRYFTEAPAKVRLAPDPYRLRSGDSELMRLVTALDNFRRQLGPDLSELVRQANVLIEQADQALKGKSGVQRFFSSRRQQETIDACAAQTPAVLAFSQTFRQRLTPIDISVMDDASILNSYRANNASFVATLESVVPRGLSARPSAPPPPHSRLGAHRHPFAPTPRPPSPQRPPSPSSRPSPTPSRPPVPTGRPVIPTGLPRPQPQLQPLPAVPDLRGGMPAELAAQIEAFPLQRGPLLATLRGYQSFGARFLCHQERSILGDDMGLGKTMQALAAMCHLWESDLRERHFMVIAPNSVLYNWEKETRQHTRIEPFVAHGAARWNAVSSWKRRGGVLITTYGSVGTIVDDIGSVSLLTVDEAHMVKNPDAARTRTVGELAARSKKVVLMSGTALENRLEELGNLVTLADPRHEALIEQLTYLGRPDPAQTRQRLAPVYLRRTQSDVLDELPPLVNILEMIEPTSGDRAAYNASQHDIMSRRHAASMGDGSLNSAKFARLGEILDEYRAEGRKVVVFSYFRDVIDQVLRISNMNESITGSVATPERQRIIERFTAADGHRVLPCQIDAGGTGINLQAAQVVILIEPQFKPSTELQAIARVRRMGQSSTVTVHRMVARDTIENRLVELVAYKQAVFNDYAHDSDLRDASTMAIDRDFEVEQAMRNASGW